MTPPAPQHLIALDMEGVVTPEIWIALAEATGIPSLRRTTRDEPDYTKLMTGRTETLDRRGIRFSAILEVVTALDPLPGGVEFLDSLRAQFPVILLSDTFEQLAAPLFTKLGSPLVVCHRLTISEDRIVGTAVRIPASKQRTVEAFAEMGYHVLAIGDSYNDLDMLRAADHGLLFRAPAVIAAAESDLPTADTYAEALAWVETHTS